MKKYIALLILTAMFTLTGCAENDTSKAAPAGESISTETKDKKSETKAKESFEEKQQKVYERLNGVWTSDSGDYIKIYKEDAYALEYSVQGEEINKSPIYFEAGYRAVANNMSITYLGSGDCTEGFAFLLAEDEQSFEYAEEVFYKEPILGD